MRTVALQAVLLLLVATLASATSLKNTVRITVLDSVTRSSTPDDNNGVPKNCEQLTFDAYCRSTTNVPLVSTLLVQVGNDPPFRIVCTIDSRYSRCTPLPKGETFDAKAVKHGLIVYYVDDKGKARSQLYKLVNTDGKTSQLATTAAVAAQPVPAAAAPRQSAPPSAPAPSVASGQQVLRETVGKVKCNFTSTPAGAEITVDGSYVGNTPSEIGVTTGTHEIVLSLAGFAKWKRELVVAPDSGIVNVTASLQRTQ
jgi:hypothetical protein